MTRNALICSLALTACAGPAAPPPEEPAPEEPAPEEPAPAPGPAEVALEDDPTPDGPACETSRECAEGQQCRGPAGCEEAWACGAPRECGEQSVAYCGCDTATFYAPENCPGRPYAHAGPCEELGVEVEEPRDAVEGNTVCTSSADCRRGYVCAGIEGCSTLWTCVRRRRMRPRCRRAEDHFCSCEGETFEASAACPGRPFLHRGYCPGDEPPPEPVEPVETPPLVAEADPAPRSPRTEPTAPPPPASRPPPPPPAPEEPAACMSNRDCPRGQVCAGAPGCASEWRCRRPAERCVADTQYFCGCNGETFTASMTCPGRPHRHRGSCPR